MYPPTDVLATAVNTVTVNLSWTPAAEADATVIRTSVTNWSSSPGTDFFGWTIDNGTEIYNGTGSYYVDTVLQGCTDYYAFWSYNATERTYYPAYMTDVVRSVTTGYDEPALPTLVVAGGYPSVGHNLGEIALTWIPGSGLTSATHTLIYMDSVNHSSWTQSNGTLIENTTGNTAFVYNLSYLDTEYFAFFSYNDTLDSYSSSCILVNATVPACPVNNVPTFTATKVNMSAITLAWGVTAGADKIYIEFNYDVPLSPWIVGDGELAYNGSITSPYVHTGLNNNRMYWYMAWGYNSTYNVYSVLGSQASAKTDANSVNKLFIGSNYHDMVHLGVSMNSTWDNLVYPSGWYGTLINRVDTWWNAQSDGAYHWKTANPKADVESNVWHQVHQEPRVPYSWWSYYVDSGLMPNPGVLYWDEYKEKTSVNHPYAWHVMDNNAQNVEISYDGNVSGAITGIGFYTIEGYFQSIELDGYHIGVHSGDLRSLDSTFTNYNSYPDPPKKEFDGYLVYSKIHLQINNQLVNVSAQDGFDEYYNQHNFIYFDLATNPITIENGNVSFKLLLDLHAVRNYNAFMTQGSDVDGDGKTGMYFSSGQAALDNFNKDGLDGIYDNARDLCYFFTYNPNIHNPGPIPGPSTTADIVLTDPVSVGKYETVNLIYFTVASTYKTNLSVYAPSDAVNATYVKITEMTSGNILYTPTESGVYTVTLTRNGVVTYTTQFQVLSQSPHGYVYTIDNPVYTNQMFTVKAYYDIADFPAAVRLSDESGAIIRQWTMNSSATPYSFTTTLGSEGKYYLKMYQVRTYDEQMVTEYVLYVKDREYSPLIELSSLQPPIGSTVTITVVNNIVGVAYMNLNYYLPNQGDRLMRSDPIGNKFQSTITWIPTAPVGLWDIKLEYYRINDVLHLLSYATANVVSAIVTPPPVTPPSSVIDIPAAISKVGPALGISDPMFRLIIGSVIVLLIMLLPLIIAWKAQLKYADRIITNPMVYSVTAIIGSLISYALGLFDLWVFVLIFIVALTFFIRSWRGQSSNSAGE